MSNKYIDIGPPHKSESGKTNIWTVYTRDREVLGHIRWFARWRQYTFWPARETLFNVGCLNHISAHCEKANEEHRQKKAKPLDKPEKTVIESSA